jgi:hypothetical protein
LINSKDLEVKLSNAKLEQQQALSTQILARWVCALLGRECVGDAIHQQQEFGRYWAENVWLMRYINNMSLGAVRQRMCGWCDTSTTWCPSAIFSRSWGLLLHGHSGMLKHWLPVALQFTFYPHFHSGLICSKMQMTVCQRWMRCVTALNGDLATW